MSEENCPTIGAMGVTSGTWMVTDDNTLVCLETGNAVAMTPDFKKIGIIFPHVTQGFELWSFKTKIDCEKKFEWLKEILMGSKP